MERSDNDVTGRSDTDVTGRSDTAVTEPERSDADVIAASLEQPAEFGTIFDRHATVVHRYVVRRLGPSDAESITGEVFRIAFERRASFDPARSRDGARPWLYGIATNLVAKQRRTEIRRVHAVARLAARRGTPLDLADDVAHRDRRRAALAGGRRRPVPPAPAASWTCSSCTSGSGSATTTSPPRSASPPARCDPVATAPGATCAS